MLQHGISNDILDDNFLAIVGVGDLDPWASVQQFTTKLFHGKLVTPVAESALRKFHDVAFVHESDRWQILVDCVLD